MMSRPVSFFLLAFQLPVALLSLLVSPATSLAQPTLSAMSPSAVKPGQTVEVTLSGGKLADPLSFWTSFPAKVELSPEKGDAGKVDTSKRSAVKCKITVPADTPVGVGGIVAANSLGASNAILVLVDDLNSAAESGKNHSREQAQTIQPPIAVDGVSQSGASDFYKFTAKTGQRLSFDVYAARLASPMDPVLWLRDQSGAELAYADDDPGLGSDCRLTYSFTLDGEYFLEVRDNRFQNGRRYRLRIGDFPLMSAAIPSGVRQGATAEVTFPSPFGEEAAPMIVQAPPSEPAGGRFYVSARRKGGDSAGLATMAIASFPEVREGETPSNPKQCTPIVLPCAVTGRLMQPGEQDYYRFVAKKGERFAFRSVSRGLGSPIFAQLRVHKADGAQVAQSPVTNNEDETIAYTIPEDGAYLLSVRDLLQRGGADFVYRVEIRRGGAFQLNVRSDKNGRDKFHVHPDGAFTVEVQAARDGYDGPITLSATTTDGRPLHVYKNQIAKKQKAVNMIVCMPPGSKAGDLEMIRIQGKAIVAGRRVIQGATSLGLVRTRWPQTPFPPPWTDGLLTAASVSATPGFYTAELIQGVAYYARGVGKAAFTVKLKRNDKNFKDALVVAVDGLPPSLSYSVKRNGNGPEETYDVTISGPGDLPEGAQRLRIMTFGDLGGNGRQFVFDQASLEVVTPLRVNVTPQGPIIAGGKQKVKIAIERFLGNQAVLELNDPRFGKVKINVERLGAGAAVAAQPVTFKWKSLPAKVTGGDFTIAPDLSEIEVEISAAADAPAGKFATLIVEAKTKFLTHDVTLASSPVELEVKPAPKPPPKKEEKKEAKK